MKNTSYQERVRQSTQDSFTASKFAIKKAVALLLAVVALGVIVAIIPKIRSRMRSYAANKISSATEETRRQMSPLEAQLENLLNGLGF